MKKFLSAILVVTLLVSTGIVATANVFAQSDAWDGATAATEFASGTGTAEDPYVIATAEQLKYFADLINGNETNANYNALSYKLAADINLGSQIWTPIGGTKLQFAGTFDGDGHTVFNFIIYDNTAALFGATNNATVANVKIDKAQIVSLGLTSGGIVGNVTKDSTLTLTNCEVGSDVIISIESLERSARVGGIWGAVDKNTVVTAKNCINRGKVMLDGSGRNDAAAGGICGAIRNGLIENCANFGSVVIKHDNAAITANAGGIVGIVISGGDTVINNVINCANVTGWTRAGGVIGYLHTGTANTKISNTFSFTDNIIVNLETGTKGTVIGGLQNADQTCSLEKVTNVAITGIATVGGEFTVEGNLMGEITSPDDLAYDFEYNAILTVLGLESVSMPVPPSEEIEPAGPDKPEETELEDVPGSEPVQDTKPVEPEASGTEPEPTEPEATNPVTPDTAPETEKPSEGGCGSVVAGGMAILAVVALAGVALKKRH